MPANRPSLTARKVASDFLFTVEELAAARLAPAGSIETTRALLRASGRLRPWMESLIRAPWYQRLGRTWEERMIPGQLMHLVLRKRFFDDEVRIAIADGAAQVLVLGGGYDTLCLRLAPEYTRVTFIEIDHPPTHRNKLEGVEAMGALAPNLHFRGVDLAAESLQEALGRIEPWNTVLPTVVVAEGVLMYLAATEVETLLADIRSATGPSSRLLLSYLHLEELSRIFDGRLGKILRYGLQIVGEPFRWGVRRDEDLRTFLGTNGYRVLDERDRYDLGQRYGLSTGAIARPVARLERVVAAEPMVAASGSAAAASGKLRGDETSDNGPRTR